VVDLSDTRVVDCLPCAGMAVDHMAVLRDECARVSELARDLDHSVPMTLACNDTDAAWRVEPADRAGFVTVERSSPDAGDVTARAADLLLLLWQRIAPESERIAYRVGPGSVRAFLEGPLTA
jgi:hypothetical protein